MLKSKSIAQIEIPFRYGDLTFRQSRDTGFRLQWNEGGVKPLDVMIGTEQIKQLYRAIKGRKGVYYQPLCRCGTNNIRFSYQRGISD